MLAEQRAALRAAVGITRLRGAAARLRAGRGLESPSAGTDPSGGQGDSIPLTILATKALVVAALRVFHNAVGGASAGPQPDP